MVPYVVWYHMLYGTIGSIEDRRDHLALDINRIKLIYLHKAVWETHKVLSGDMAVAGEVDPYYEAIYDAIMPNIITLTTDVLTLLADPNDFTTVLARDSNNVSVMPNHPDAVKFNWRGAWMRQFNTNSDNQERVALWFEGLFGELGNLTYTEGLALFTQVLMDYEKAARGY